MKKIVLLLLLLPVVLQSQNQDEWLTPFADVSFVDDKIVYSYCRSQLLVVHNIIPRYYSESLMELRPGLNMPALNPSDVAHQQQMIREYLKEEDAIELNTSEQEEYLRLAAMVLIWDLELDEHTILELTNLKKTNNEKLINETNVILELQKVYKSLN